MKVYEHLTFCTFKLSTIEEKKYLLWSVYTCLRTECEKLEKMEYSHLHSTRWTQEVCWTYMINPGKISLKSLFPINFVLHHHFKTLLKAFIVSQNIYNESVYLFFLLLKHKIFYSESRFKIYTNILTIHDLYHM